MSNTRKKMFYTIIHLLGGFIIAALFYVLGAAFIGWISEGDMVVTLSESLIVWVLAIVGFPLGYKYAFRILGWIIDGA